MLHQLHIYVDDDNWDFSFSAMVHRDFEKLLLRVWQICELLCACHNAFFVQLFWLNNKNHRFWVMAILVKITRNLVSMLPWLVGWQQIQVSAIHYWHTLMTAWMNEIQVSFFLKIIQVQEEIEKSMKQSSANKKPYKLFSLYSHIQICFQCVCRHHVITWQLKIVYK